MVDPSTPLPFFLVYSPLTHLDDVDVVEWLQNEIQKMGIIEKEMKIMSPRKYTKLEIAENYITSTRDLIMTCAPGIERYIALKNLEVLEASIKRIPKEE